MTAIETECKLILASLVVIYLGGEGWKGDGKMEACELHDIMLVLY